MVAKAYVSEKARGNKGTLASQPQPLLGSTLPEEEELGRELGRFGLGAVMGLTGCGSSLWLGRGTSNMCKVLLSEVQARKAPEGLKHRS